jgi:hypothetical protein
MEFYLHSLYNTTRFSISVQASPRLIRVPSGMCRSGDGYPALLGTLVPFSRHCIPEEDCNLDAQVTTIDLS